MLLTNDSFKQESLLLNIATLARKCVEISANMSRQTIPNIIITTNKRIKTAI